ncbi:MAG: hypothetical protein H6719_06440 [Sandaracinaceae bacterium]|nr:hypothetical protein [Sandaracinaceae bacterium]
MHVPAGAVDEEINVVIREGELPLEHRAVLAGPVVALFPDGQRFARPVTVTLPAFEGPDPSALGLSFHDGMTGTWTEAARTGGGYSDPVAQLRPEVTGETDHFSVWAATFRAPIEVQLDNAFTTPVDVHLIATRPLATEDDPAVPWTFAIPRAEELHAYLPPGAGSAFALLPGEYLFRVTAGAAAYCVPVAVAPASTPAAVALSDTLAECAPPMVTLEGAPALSRIGDRVTLTAVGQSTSPTLSYYVNLTGGRLIGSRVGMVSAGESLTIEWEATRAGTFELYVTMYDPAGQFGEARAVLPVRGNERPSFVSLTTAPRRITQGFPEGSRMLAPGDSPDDTFGLTLLSAVTEDPDGDPTSVFWWHALPGNYFDPATGAMLGRDPRTGYATVTATGEPFIGDEVYYMAPQASFLCNGFPAGLWLGLHATVSDGVSVARSWAMIGMECIYPIEDSSHCISSTHEPDPRRYGSTRYCSGVHGPRPDWLSGECPGDANDGPCPGDARAGACVDTDPPESSFGTSVWYGLTPEGAAEAAAACDGPDDVWIYPYDP